MTTLVKADEFSLSLHAGDILSSANILSTFTKITSMIDSSVIQQKQLDVVIFLFILLARASV
jgi:hypothetical protein